MTKLAVIGAGIVGSFIAWRLAQHKKFNIHLFDQMASATAAPGCTSAAAGMLAPKSEQWLHKIGNISGESRTAHDPLNEGLRLWRRYAALLQRQASFTPIFYARGTKLFFTEDRGENRSIWFEQETSLNPRKVLQALHKAFCRSGGYLSCGKRGKVEAVEAVNNKQWTICTQAACPTRPVFDHIILATGGPPAFALPVRNGPMSSHFYSARGQTVEIEAPLLKLQHILREGSFYITPRGADRYIIGASMQPGDLDRRARSAERKMLLAWARKCLPQLNQFEVIADHVGIRPMSFSGLPIMGQSRERPGMHWALGHGRNGVLLAPWSAKQIEKQLVEAAR